MTPDQRRLAAGFAPRAAAIAQRAARRTGMLREADDLRGVAFAALASAAVRYVPGKAAFSTYAWRRVTGAVLDEVRRLRKRVSVEAPLDAAMEIAAGAIAGEDGAARVKAATGRIVAAYVAVCAEAEALAGAEARALQSSARAVLATTLATLGAEEHALLAARREGRTWAEVGDLLGIGERGAKARGAALRARLAEAVLPDPDPTPLGGDNGPGHD